MSASAIDLGDGSTATVEFEYGTKAMTHLRNAPSEPHKTTTAKIIVKKGEESVSVIEGISYCSPVDQFDRNEGRLRALKRAVVNAKSLLPKLARQRIGQEFIAPTARRQAQRSQK